MSERSVEPDGIVRGFLRPGERAWTRATLGLMLVGVPIGMTCCAWVLDRLGQWPALAAFAGVVAGELGLALSVRRMTRRGWEEVEQARFLVCLTCRHPLLARPEARGWLCPECGASWNHEVLERSWRWTYTRSG